MVDLAALAAKATLTDNVKTTTSATHAALTIVMRADVTHEDASVSTGTTSITVPTPTIDAAGLAAATVTTISAATVKTATTVIVVCVKLAVRPTDTTKGADRTTLHRVTVGRMRTDLRVDTAVNVRVNAGVKISMDSGVSALPIASFTTVDLQIQRALTQLRHHLQILQRH
jgi:hypothetical protein